MTPLSTLQTGAALGAEALRALRRVARGARVRREPGVVMAEYDGGYWSGILAERRWERCATLEEFVVPSDTRERVAKVANQLVRISNTDYYRYRRQMLQSVLREFADTTELAELGCGYGANLFGLTAGPWRRLSGFEVSSAALQAAALIRAHFELQDIIEFHRLDLVDDADPAFSRLRGMTAFTYYCFEQLKHSTTRAVANIMKAGVRRVIHFEPTPELWSRWSPGDAVSRLYSWSQDYQDNLLATLRRLEREGAVRIVDVRRLYYAPGVRHDPTLICWEPRQ